MFLNKLFGKYKFITMWIILAVLLASLVGVILHFFVLPGESTSEIETTSHRTAETHVDEGVLSGDSTFLVVCTDDAGGVAFMLLADFKIYSQSIVITPLSENTATDNGKSYGECYSYGGINLLESCVESVRSINIDRYAVINKSGISKLTDLMGEVSLYAQEDFSYESSDKTYEVSMGNNEMGADMLYTYLLLISNKAEGEQKVAELVCKIINFYISDIDAQDASELFGDVTNCFTTNVTISDYYTANADIEYLLNNGVSCVISNDVES